MIVLPRITLSSRLRNRADHESKRFLQRVQDMRWRDLRTLLLAGHTDRRNSTSMWVC